MKTQFSILLFFVVLNLGCNDSKLPKASQMVYILQPFEGMKKNEINFIYNQLKIILPNIHLNSEIPFPTSAYYSPRNRYRADSLIHFLSKKHKRDTVLIGLTYKDISTQNEQHKDWGVMGLAYCPGNACIASTYRLNKNNLYLQYYKVVIHELAHTQGLPHCKNKWCYLRDAEGKNPTDEEKEFCTDCKNHLKKRNWKL